MKYNLTLQSFSNLDGSKHLTNRGNENIFYCWVHWIPKSHMMRKILTSLLFLLLIVPSLHAQQLKATVSLQADRLDPTYQSSLQNFKYDIEQYINNYEYTDDAYNTEVPVTYNVYIEQASESGTETTYSAQLLVTDGNNQRYFDKNWEFSYSSGQVYQHGIFTPVTAVIDFYAYLILAGTVDTYGRLAGTPYYNTALSIANQSSRSGLGTGWRDRMKLLDDLQNHRDLRSLKYTFFDAYWDFQESNTSDAKIGFDDSMNLIEKILDHNRDDKFTKIFLEGTADRVAWLAAQLKNYDALKTLSTIDPDNKSVYQKYMP